VCVTHLNRGRWVCWRRRSRARQLVSVVQFFTGQSIHGGDAGAIPLGSLAAWGFDSGMLGYWPWWFAALVFSPFYR
jgi:hypothetical protein